MGKSIILMTSWVFQAFDFSNPVFYYRELWNTLWLVTDGLDVLWTLVHQATSTCSSTIVANNLQWHSVVFIMVVLSTVRRLKFSTVLHQKAVCSVIVWRFRGQYLFIDTWIELFLKNIGVTDPLCSSLVETSVLIWCVLVHPAHFMLPEHVWHKRTNTLQWARGCALWLYFTLWLHYYQTSWHKDRVSAHDLQSCHIAWCGKVTASTLNPVMCNAWNLYHWMKNREIFFCASILWCNIEI